MHPDYKKPKTGTGDLRTPVTFFAMEPDSGPEPGGSRRQVLHGCMCEAYNPSMKDLSILDTTGTKEAVTIRIRDTAGEYVPTNKHSAELGDYRYTGKVFSILDVRPDLKDNRFTTILLGVTS